MRYFRWLIVILVLSGVIAQTPVVSLKSLMTVREFETAGLNKLTKDELQALDSWFMKFVVNFTQRTTATSKSAALPGTYPVEGSVNDETFIINGEVFKAKTYCFNVDKVDRVKFIEGSALGACASAKFLNTRSGDVCDVWGE
jgi:hypothetical protein